MTADTVTRFAPSPTGYLHLGHAYSALFAAQQAEASDGHFLVRIEDIDAGRCRPAFEDAIFEDLAWLGIQWETPARRQSEHMADYAAALERLDGRNLLYPCFCTRADIRREIEAAGHAPHEIPAGPDGPVYPGICRSLSPTERNERIVSGAAYAMRLDMTAAVDDAAVAAATVAAPPPPPQPQLQPPGVQQQWQAMDDERAPKRTPASPLAGDSPSEPRAKRTLALPPGLPPPSAPPSPPSPAPPS